MILYLDTETYSEVPISAGTHAYAAGAEIMLVAYAIDDEPVYVWDRTDDRAAPPGLQNALAAGDVTVVVHNSHFDRTVLRHAMGCDLPTERIHDTMAMARAHGLPGSLETLCELFKIADEQAKDKRGKQLIQLFCKPRPKNVKLRRATRDTHPEEWEQFKEYAAKDIEAMRELYRRLPRWNYPELEQRLWCLDQCINDRGVAIDVDFARAAIDAVGIENVRLTARSAALTGGELETTRQRNALYEYLIREYNIELPDLQASTIEKYLETAEEIHGVLRELLLVRLQSTTASTAKYKKLMTAVSADGRLRGTLEYCGAARTGRWAGRLFQPQNLPRPTMKAKDIEAGIAAIKSGCADLLFDDVMSLASNALRGVIVAPPGKKLVVSDLSNIEGRVLAWLAGEQWKLDAFREFDAGKGHDLYKLAYARAFNIAPEGVTKDQRQLGKVMELALGYQGSVGAFSTMAALYNMELPEETIKELVQAWRRANINIRNFWYQLEDLVKATAGVAEMKPAKLGRVSVARKGAWLRIILPSGRSLCYASPRLEEGKLTYMGVNSYTRKWERIQTYGGKLVENITQAVARDVMAANMLRIEEHGFDIVLSVHDELITEAPDEAFYDSDKLSELLATNPDWADGLPLAAGGFECYRYRKE